MFACRASKYETAWQLSRLFMSAALALMTIARDICVFGDESQCGRVPVFT